MAHSETIDDESFKAFTTQCNAMITQQYLIVIKQLITDGDYNEAQRLKREYQDNYPQSDAIDAIDVPYPQAKDMNDDDDEDKSFIDKIMSTSSENKIAVVVIVVILLIIIIAMCSSSHGDDSYDDGFNIEEELGPAPEYYPEECATEAVEQSYESEAIEERQAVDYPYYESEPSYNSEYSSGYYNDNSADVWQ